MPENQSCQGVAEQDRWNAEEAGAIIGTPWAPRGGEDEPIGIRIDMPEHSRDHAEHPPGAMPEVDVRRARLYKQDFLDHGLTEGCPGCTAANRGLRMDHNGTCRNMME